MDYDNTYVTKNRTGWDGVQDLKTRHNDILITNTPPNSTDNNTLLKSCGQL